MSIKDVIAKKKGKKDKKFAQVAMESDFYHRVEKVLKANGLKWQTALHAGLEQFLSEYEKQR